MNPLRVWWRALHPAALTMGWREFGFGSLGLGLGVWLTGWLSRLTLGDMNPWFIAPMGASAILLFLLPAGPMGQPWSILGGNLVSAVIGVSCAQCLGHGIEVAALAGTMAALAMRVLRCLHPPGGAVALTAVLGGPAIQQLGYGFALWPVGVNSAFMMLLALLFHHATGRRHPDWLQASEALASRKPKPMNSAPIAPMPAADRRRWRPNCRARRTPPKIRALR